MIADLFESNQFVQFGALLSNQEDVKAGIEKRLRQYGVIDDFQEFGFIENSFNIHVRYDERNYDITKTTFELLSFNEANVSMYCCNLNDAWHSLFWGVISDLKCSAIFVSSAPENEKDNNRYIQNFELFEHGEVVRHVRVMYEDEWLFYERGNRLEIEANFGYANRLKRKRLTRQNVKTLVTAFLPDLSRAKKIRSYVWSRIR